MAGQVFECAEDAGGCGAIWTPTIGNRRPIKHRPPWAWCPDCIRAGVPDAQPAEENRHERRARERRERAA